MSEEEYAFYSLLLSYQNLPLEDKKAIEEIARELVRILSPYIKVSDWKRNEYIKSKIKVEIKKILLKKGIKNYNIIKNLSELIVEHTKAIA